MLHVIVKGLNSIISNFFMNVSISILFKKVWNPYRLHITFLSPWRCKYRNPFSCLFIYESDSRELPHRRHNNSYNNKGSFLGEFWGIQCYESRLLQLDSRFGEIWQPCKLRCFSCTNET